VIHLTVVFFAVSSLGCAQKERNQGGVMPEIFHFDHHVEQHKEDILLALQIPAALLALGVMFFLS
jgi:hypothetical protein